MVFVSGKSGVGKSSLYREFVRRTQSQSSENVFHFCGKFLDVKTSRPFHAIVDAISGWCKILLHDKTYAVFCSSIRSFLNDTIGDKMLSVLLRIIPELRSLMSKHGEYPGCEETCSLSTMSVSLDEKRADKVNMSMLKQLFQSFKGKKRRSDEYFNKWFLIILPVLFSLEHY